VSPACGGFGSLLGLGTRSLLPSLPAVGRIGRLGSCCYRPRPCPSLIARRPQLLAPGYNLAPRFGGLESNVAGRFSARNSSPGVNTRLRVVEPKRPGQTGNQAWFPTECGSTRSRSLITRPSEFVADSLEFSDARLECGCYSHPVV